MDSRLSGGSTQSEVLAGDKKKKKGLFGKLKKLTKSRSIDDANGSQEDFSMKVRKQGKKVERRKLMRFDFRVPEDRIPT